MNNTISLLYHKNKYVNFLFKKLQREQGLLERDCDRMVRNDRVIWSSCMVSCGDADAMVTGNTRHYASSLDKIKKVIKPRPGEIMFGLNMIVKKGKTVFIGDTSVHEYPNAEQLSEIAISSARASLAALALIPSSLVASMVKKSTLAAPVEVSPMRALPLMARVASSWAAPSCREPSKRARVLNSVVVAIRSSSSVSSSIST